MLIQVDIVVDEVGGSRWPPVIVDEGDHLPIGERNCDAAIDWIVCPEDRTSEHGRALADPACVAEDIVFEAEPGALIEGRELRCAIGEVEGVVIGDAGARPPIRVFAADKVAAVEVVVGVELIPGLGLFENSPVKRPWVASTRDRNARAAINVDAGEER